MAPSDEPRVTGAWPLLPSWELWAGAPGFARASAGRCGRVGSDPADGGLLRLSPLSAFQINLEAVRTEVAPARGLQRPPRLLGCAGSGGAESPGLREARPCEHVRPSHRILAPSPSLCASGQPGAGRGAGFWADRGRCGRGSVCLLEGPRDPAALTSPAGCFGGHTPRALWPLSERDQEGRSVVGRAHGCE